MQAGRIEGVLFPEDDVQALLYMFADDLAAIIRAMLQYIEEFRNILEAFGNVSGLKCAWDQTIASYIPARPPPMEFWLLRWKWEDNQSASPLLGVPTAQTIANDHLRRMNGKSEQCCYQNPTPTGPTH